MIGCIIWSIFWQTMRKGTWIWVIRWGGRSWDRFSRKWMGL